jgi:hypothetical protein
MLSSILSAKMDLHKIDFVFGNRPLFEAPVSGAETPLKNFPWEKKLTPLKGAREKIRLKLIRPAVRVARYFLAPNIAKR